MIPETDALLYNLQIVSFDLHHMTSQIIPFTSGVAPATWRSGLEDSVGLTGF